MKVIRALLVIVLSTSWVLPVESAVNLLTNSGFENFTAGTSYGNTIIENGGWRYFSVNGANGSLLAVMPGQEGNIALRLTRGSSAGDSGIDRSNAKTPASPGSCYRGQVWAKSNTGSSLNLAISAYNSSHGFIESATRIITLDSTYRKYDVWYKASANVSFVILALRVSGTGEIFVDNCSLMMDNSRMGLGSEWVRSHPFQLVNFSVYKNSAVTNDLDVVISGKSTLQRLQELKTTGLKTPYIDSLAGAHANGIIRHIPLGADKNGITETMRAVVNINTTSNYSDGFYVRDEPASDEYQYVADVMDWLRDYRPYSLIYVNSCNFSSSEIDKWYASMHPDIWCGDFYPFHNVPWASGSTDMEDTNFLGFIKTARDKALVQGVPYLAWIQAFSGNDYWKWREPSESELRMSIWCHLTMGYTGLLYYGFDERLAGWTWIVDADYFVSNPPCVTERPLYNWIKSANAEVEKQGRYLRYLRSTRVFFIPNSGHSVPSGMSQWSAGVDDDPYIQGITLGSSSDKKDALIGLFTDDYNRRFFMVQNLWRDTTSAASAKTSTITLSFLGATLPVPGKVYRLDRSTGLSTEVPLSGSNLVVSLSGGTADLFSYEPFDLRQSSIVSNIVSSTNLVSDDTTRYTVTMTAYNPDGAESIKDMRIMFHSGGDFTSSNGRGYLCWAKNAAAITEFGGTWTQAYPAVGDGYYAIRTDAYGSYNYVTSRQVSTSTTAYTRTLTVEFSVKLAWGAAQDQRVRGFTRDVSGSGRWIESPVEYDIAVPASGVKGVIVLKDYVGDITKLPVIVELTKSDGTKTTYVIYTDSTGGFFIPDVPPGVYSVSIKASYWLRKTVRNVTVSGQTDLSTILLVNGDVDGDNEITSTDLGIVLSNLGKPGQIGDLNGDGAVTNVDVNIVLAGIDLRGDTVSESATFGISGQGILSNSRYDELFIAGELNVCQSQRTLFMV